MTTLEICPRCSGEGKLDWTKQDNGLCYKCEGSGYLGRQTEDKDGEMNAMRLRSAELSKNSNMVSSMIKAVSEKIGGKGCESLYSCVWNSEACGFELKRKYVLGNFKSRFVDLFEMPHVDKLEQAKRYSNQGLNADFASELREQDIENKGLRYVKMEESITELVGDFGFATISKTGRNEVTVTFNLAKFE